MPLTIPIIPECQNELLLNGWFRLSALTEAEALDILNQLGRIIYTTEVTVNPESKSLVTSAKSLDLHTDHHKAKYIAWYCLKQADIGGESILADAEMAYTELNSDFQKELHNLRLFEHKIFPDDQEFHTLVKTNSKFEREFYYSFWLVKKSDASNPALKAFQSKLETIKKEKFKLLPLDLLIIDNHRILHGRTAIGGNRDRLLKRYWLSSN